MPLESCRTSAAFVPLNTTVAEMVERYYRRLRAMCDATYSRDLYRMLQSYLVERYGSMPINEFTVLEAEETVRRMRRTLSAVTVTRYGRVMRAAFESEFRNGRLVDNPWNHVHLPPATSPSKRRLSDEEVLRLQEAFSHNALGDYFGFIMQTGLRRAEASGVVVGKWDRENHALRIDTHVDYKKHYKARLEPGAYRGFDRVIALSHEAEECLGRAVDRQEAYHRLYPSWRNPDDLMFTNRVGRPVLEHDITYNTEVIRRVTGIRDFSTMLLRNDFVMRKLEAGVPFELLKTYLGLRDQASLMKYVAPDGASPDQAAQCLEDYFASLMTARQA